MAGSYNKYNANGDRGQTIVEFSLILLLLIVLLFGITEFGRAWRYSNALTSSARAGARFASTLPPDTADFYTQVKDYTWRKVTADIDDSGITTDDITIEFKDKDGVLRVPQPDFDTVPPVKGEDTVTVTVLYRFEVLTGSIVPFFSGTKLLRRNATMLYQPPQ